MERVVVHLASGLAERGVSVLVVCLQNPGVLASELVDSKINLIALKSSRGKDISAAWRLRTELLQFRPLVISVHDYTSLPYSILANLLTFKSSPVLFTAHGLLFEGFEPLKRRLRFFSSFLTGISAVSEKVAQRHQRYLNWQKPITLISNGVPIFERSMELHDKVREELGCPDDKFLFLVVGNPRPEKGFEDLLDAVALLRKNHDHFLVAVAGTLSDSKYCQSLLTKLESLELQKHCCFLGFRDDTLALYSAADAFVLSSRSEGLPMVILEAMTAGLPIIATCVGGVPDVVGDKGLLVPPTDPNKLSSAMHRLIVDRKLARQLGNAGQVHAKENYGVDSMVENYIAYYKDALRLKQKY